MINVRNDNAVSPVIGVILMVAITVILAAVVAAFVFGMTGNIQKTKVVAASGRHIGTVIHITYHGGQDQDLVDSLTYSIDGSTLETLGKTVGSTVMKIGYPAQAHLVIIAKFTDGTEQVISDAFI